MRMVRFAAEQPGLMFTRVVPGFAPSQRACAPSLRVAELMQAAMAAAVEHGELHPAAASENGVALLLVMVGGVDLSTWLTNVALSSRTAG
jgi:hypothetical protein